MKFLLSNFQLKLNAPADAFRERLSPPLAARGYESEANVGAIDKVVKAEYRTFVHDIAGLRHVETVDEQHIGTPLLCKPGFTTIFVHLVELFADERVAIEPSFIARKETF